MCKNRSKAAKSYYTTNKTHRISQHIEKFALLCYNSDGHFSHTQEGVSMTCNYNRLWKLLIDKGMTKKQMRKAVGISTNILAKMVKG